MANEEHLAILKQGVAAWNQWRKENPDRTPDFSLAKLSEANLGGANFAGAYLAGASLSSADLREAHLNGANLFAAELSGANLRAASLLGANLNMLNFVETNLCKARIGHSSFSNVDLSQATGLETVAHEYPSSIGVDTLALTLRGSGGRFTEEQLVFFEMAGVPHTLLEYLPSILEANPLQFYSCFISYSTKDEDFAERLNQDLTKTGVKTWKWNLDAVPGRDLRENIDRAVRNYDKMILVCSAEALASGPVEREIERALQKEDQLKSAKSDRVKEAKSAGREPPYVDTDVLVPITLDNTIYNWDSHFAADVLRKYVPDFSGKAHGKAEYDTELRKLIEALNPKSWPPQPVAIRNS